MSATFQVQECGRVCEQGIRVTVCVVAMQGVLPNMIKLAPAAGISWFMFEEVKRMLGVDIRS